MSDAFSDTAKVRPHLLLHLCRRRRRPLRRQRPDFSESSEQNLTFAAVLLVCSDAIDKTGHSALPPLPTESIECFGINRSAQCAICPGFARVNIHTHTLSLSAAEW